jgi:hypothetical protein
MQSSVRAMSRLSGLIAGFLLVTCVPQRTFASDTCTIMYRVDATFEISDTDLGKDDRRHPKAEIARARRGAPFSRISRGRA